MKEVFIKLEPESWLHDIENFKNKDLVSIEDLLGCIEDLYDENLTLKEQTEDLKEDIKENYEPKEQDPYDYYGVSKEDFE